MFWETQQIIYHYCTIDGGLKMMIIKTIGTIVAFAIYFSWLPLPVVLVTIVPYYFTIRHLVGRYLNPFVKSDLILPFVVSFVWVTASLMSTGGKSMANIAELFVLGIAWSFLWLVRLVLICVVRNEKKSFCFYANCGLIIHYFV